MSVAEALKQLYGVKPGERRWQWLQLLLEHDEVAPLEELNFLGQLCKVRGGQLYDDTGYWDELEIFRCADGCQKLAFEIAREIQTRYGARLLMKRAVTNINISQGVLLGSKAVADQETGRLASGLPAFETFDYVILALPPNVWPKSIGPEHPKDKIGVIGMGPAIKFFSDVKKRFWIQEKAAPLGGSVTLGQIWEGTDNQTRIGNQGIVLSVYAGARVPTEKAIMNELSRIYPHYSENLNKKPLFRNWSTVPFINTGYASPRKGEILTIGKKLNEPFLSRLFFAGEHTQMDFFGYMEGALRSGERAANMLLLQSCGVKEPAIQIASESATFAHELQIPLH